MKVLGYWIDYHINDEYISYNYVSIEAGLPGVYFWKHYSEPSSRGIYKYGGRVIDSESEIKSFLDTYLNPNSYEMVEDNMPDDIEEKLRIELLKSKI